MRFDELNESNYLLFAIKFYDNPQAVTKDDFESDLKRIRYVKRLLKKYKNSRFLYSFSSKHIGNTKEDLNEMLKKININNEIKYLRNTNGILTFSDTEINNLKTFKNYFDIYVGMVSGKETIFKNNKYGKYLLNLIEKKN